MSPSVYPILLLSVLLSFVVACVLVLKCCECVCCKVRPRSVVCVAIGNAVLFIFRSRLLLYSAWTGVLCVLLDRPVWSSKECVCCACDPRVHLSVPSIGFVCVFVCRKLSPHLRV